MARLCWSYEPRNLDLGRTETWQEWAQRVKKECENSPHPNLVLPQVPEVMPMTRPTGKIFKWRHDAGDKASLVPK